MFLLVREGAIVRANVAWKNLVGLRTAELAGRALADFIHPEDHALLQTLGDDPKQEQQVRVLPGGPNELRGTVKAQPVDMDETLLVAIRDLDDAEDPASTEAARRALARLRDANDISLWRYSHANLEFVYDLDFSRPPTPTAPRPRRASAAIG